MKSILHLLFLFTSIQSFSQCIIDSVHFDRYTAVSIYDKKSYQSIDSTIKYDKPNVSWIDIYNNGKIIKRFSHNTFFYGTVINFEYKAGKISKIYFTNGFKQTYLFTYQDSLMSGFSKNSLIESETNYTIEHIPNGYLFRYKNNETGKQLCKKVDINLLQKCGICFFGNIDFLNDEFNINTTNYNCNVNKDNRNWPNNEYYNITCIKDECGNTTIYSKQNKETKYIIELYLKKYFYK